MGLETELVNDLGGPLHPRSPSPFCARSWKSPFPETRPDGSQENMHPSDSRLTDLTRSWGKGAVLETGLGDHIYTLKGEPLLAATPSLTTGTPAARLTVPWARG